jgi:hypothetical protein
MDTLSKLTIDTKVSSPINKNTKFTFDIVNSDNLIIKNKLLTEINYNYELEINKLKTEAINYNDTITKLMDKNKRMRTRHMEIINELHIKNIYLIDKFNEYKNKSWCC